MPYVCRYEPGETNLPEIPNRSDRRSDMNTRTIAIAALVVAVILVIVLFVV